jgi:hypothetical protein
MHLVGNGFYAVDDVMQSCKKTSLGQRFVHHLDKTLNKKKTRNGLDQTFSGPKNKCLGTR